MRIPYSVDQLPITDYRSPEEKDEKHTTIPVVLSAISGGLWRSGDTAYFDTSGNGR
jgi:hypothetical protein